MNQIMAPEAKLLANEISIAMTEIAKRHGLEVVPHGGTYTGVGYSRRVEFKVTHAVEKEKTNNSKELNAFYGLNIGQQVKIQGTAFIIIGYKPNKPKNCLEIKRIKDGKTFVCSPDAIEK